MTTFHLDGGNVVYITHSLEILTLVFFFFLVVCVSWESWFNRCGKNIEHS